MSGDEYGEPEKKPSRRGFAKIDVVDVILSADPKSSGKGTTTFEQLTESTISKGLLYAPTYRLEPKKKFDSDVVLKILIECLEKDSKEMSYSEKECQNACKRISYYIRRAVKQLSYDRKEATHRLLVKTYATPRVMNWEIFGPAKDGLRNLVPEISVSETNVERAAKGILRSILDSNPQLTTRVISRELGTDYSSTPNAEEHIECLGFVLKKGYREKNFSFWKPHPCQLLSVSDRRTRTSTLGDGHAPLKDGNECLKVIYRIICQVRIVEKQNQGIETRTGFLWDPNIDGFVTHTVDTQSYVAQAVVFGVYKY